VAHHPPPTDIIDQTRDLLPSFRAIQDALCDLSNEIDLIRATNLKHTRPSLTRLKHALNKITITDPTAIAEPAHRPSLEKHHTQPIGKAGDDPSYKPSPGARFASIRHHLAYIQKDVNELAAIIYSQKDTPDA